MNSVKPDSRLERGLLAAAIALLAFDQIPYFPKLHGFGFAASNFPLAALAALWLGRALRGQAEFPRGKGPALFLAFIAWAALCTLVNARSIAHAAMPFPGGPTGVHRVLTQGAALGFGAAIALATYDLMRRGKVSLADIQRWAIWSFVPVFLYSIPELAYLRGHYHWAAATMNFIAPKVRCTDATGFPFALPAVGFPRFHAVCGEPAQFGYYLAFALPWLVALALKPGRLRWLWTAALAYAGVLAFCSVSQTVYAIAAAEIGAMLALSAWKNPASRRFSLRLSAFLAAALAAGFLIYWGHIYYPSTPGLPFGRWLFSLKNDGVRYANFLITAHISAHHPLFGVGWGQAGFYTAPYIARWHVIQGAAGFTWWSTASLYANILIEAGIAGLIFWIALWAGTAAGAFESFRHEHEGHLSKLALMASGAGWLLAFVATDNLWSPGIWIWLGLAWAVAAGI